MAMKVKGKKSKPPRGWETRNKIFAAALSLCGQVGVTQRMIAKKAGVQPMRVTEHMIKDREVERIVNKATSLNNKGRIIGAIEFFRREDIRVNLSDIMRKASVNPDTFYYWIKRSISIRRGIAEIRRKSALERVMDAIKQLISERQYMICKNVYTKAGISRRTFTDLEKNHPEIKEEMNNGIRPPTAKRRLAETVGILISHGPDINLSRRQIAKIAHVDRETVLKYEKTDVNIAGKIEMVTPISSCQKIAIALKSLYLKGQKPSIENIAKQSGLARSTVRENIKSNPEIAMQIQVFLERIKQRKASITLI